MPNENTDGIRERPRECLSSDQQVDAGLICVTAERSERRAFPPLPLSSSQPRGRVHDKAPLARHRLCIRRGRAHPVASARTAVGDGVPEGADGVAERSGGGAAQRPGVAVDEPRTRACTSRPRAGWAHIVFAAPGHFFDATVVSGGGARRTVIAVDIRSRPLPAEADLRWGTPGVKSAWAATLAAAAAGGNAAAGGYAAV